MSIFSSKDNAPGCTRQACAFAGAFEEFKQINAVVIGIGKDSAASHKKFAEKYSLPFILPSDPELTAIQAFRGTNEYGPGALLYVPFLRNTLWFSSDSSGGNRDPSWSKARIASLFSDTKL